MPALAARVGLDSSESGIRWKINVIPACNSSGSPEEGDLDVGMNRSVA
jgi:hypothetical protein